MKGLESKAIEELHFIRELFCCNKLLTNGFTLIIYSQKSYILKKEKQINLFTANNKRDTTYKVSLTSHTNYNTF